MNLLCANYYILTKHKEHYFSLNYCYKVKFICFFTIRILFHCVIVYNNLISLCLIVTFSRLELGYTVVYILLIITVYIKLGGHIVKYCDEKKTGS